MAGLSQGGGVGLSLANWMVNGDPQDDIWGMDVARYGDWATLAYTNAKVRENYSRRFRITFPNEELPAARPLHTTPIYDRLTAHNAVWGAGFGLEHPLWFQEPGRRADRGRHVPSLQRVPDSWPRSRGPFANGSGCPRPPTSPSTGSAARARPSGCRGCSPTRCRRSGARNLTAMLNPQGRIVGEFSVSRVGPDEFFLFGSQAAEVHHPRWFLDHLPAGQGPGSTLRGARSVDGRPHGRRAARRATCCRS